MPTDAYKYVAANEERVLLLTPSGRDAELISAQLHRRKFDVTICGDADSLCHEIKSGAGVVFVAVEALNHHALECLVDVLDDQPPWSSLPLVIMTEPGETSAFGKHLEELFKSGSNLTLLERPIRLATLFSVISSEIKSRRRQYQVRKLLEESKQAVTQRDQFLAMLGHELRNPLAAMVSAVAILRDFGMEDPELATEQTQLLARQATHMTRLVDDLLDVARITSGKISLNLSRLDLRETAAKALQTVNAMTGEQRHEISFETTGEPVIVDGDSVRLEQVVVNLLTNAVKYTPQGGKVWLSVSDGEEAVLRVRDSGEGFSEKVREHIFEPFAQVSPTLARSRGGLGIGLAVVKSLVEMHGGQVQARSDGMGKGAEFVIRLPIVQASHLPQVSHATRKPTHPCRILLVEDNADARLALTRLLQLSGHQVETAADGVQGLQIALSTQPDVILMDIGLPGLNGYEVAARIREKHSNSVFMIALTGYGQSEDAVRAKQAGFNLHLVKPVDPGYLSEVLANLRCGQGNWA